MTRFKVNIKISPNDLNVLKKQGYSLCVLKAVRTNGEGVATVWCKLDANELSTDTSIHWDEAFFGYNSISPIASGVHITPSNTVTTNLGNLISIDESEGLTDSPGGVQGAITFQNNEHEGFTVGISQVIEGENNILCAFPLSGYGISSSITPIPKIIVLLSTERILTETIITRAMTTGAFIDLTGVESRDVSFCIDNGWSAGGASWMKLVPALTNMTPLLIENIE